MKTIFDTDFSDDEEVVLYRGTKFAWSGKVGDMTEELKREFDVSTWVLLDQSVEEFKALFVA
jgi:hypothetical protein